MASGWLPGWRKVFRTSPQDANLVRLAGCEFPWWWYLAIGSRIFRLNSFLVEIECLPYRTHKINFAVISHQGLSSQSNLLPLLRFNKSEPPPIDLYSPGGERHTRIYIYIYLCVMYKYIHVYIVSLIRGPFVGQRISLPSLN